jgi:hypothetical protein
MNMTGSSTSLRGNVLVNTFTLSGASDVHIDQGTIMALSPDAGSATFSTSKAVRFTSTGENNQPNIGLTYGNNYIAKPETYQEVSR